MLWTSHTQTSPYSSTLSSFPSSTSDPSDPSLVLLLQCNFCLFEVTVNINIEVGIVSQALRKDVVTLREAVQELERELKNHQKGNR